MFARKEMCFSLLEVTVLAVITPLMACVFCFVFMAVQRKTSWSQRSMLISHLLVMGLIPIWGCVGFFTDAVGLHSKMEFW